MSCSQNWSHFKISLRLDSCDLFTTVFFLINLVKMYEWMDGQSEPTLSRACWASPGPYRPIGQFPAIGRILNQKFNVPTTDRHTRPSHSTDFNWPRLFPPAGPSLPGVSYIKRRSVLNPGSNHLESSILPTELWDGYPSQGQWYQNPETYAYNSVNWTYPEISMKSIKKLWLYMFFPENSHLSMNDYITFTWWPDVRS